MGRGDGEREGRERERKTGVKMVWRAKSKPANHEAESAESLARTGDLGM